MTSAQYGEKVRIFQSTQSDPRRFRESISNYLPIVWLTGCLLFTYFFLSLLPNAPHRVQTYFTFPYECRSLRIELHPTCFS